MRYRKLDPNGDYSFGHQQADFYIDQPEGVAQAISTRLHLNYGEWFLDTSDGTPWNEQVLGNRTAAFRDAVIKARVLGTVGAQSLVSYASQFNGNTRAFAVQLTVDTQYGVTPPLQQNMLPPWLLMPQAPTNLVVTGVSETTIDIAWSGP